MELSRTAKALTPRPVFHDYVPQLRTSIRRNNVDHVLLVFLRLPGVPHTAETGPGRLLRLLQLWVGAVSADPRGRELLSIGKKQRQQT